MTNIVNLQGTAIDGGSEIVEPEFPTYLVIFTDGETLTFEGFLIAQDSWVAISKNPRDIEAFWPLAKIEAIYKKAENTN